MKLILTILLIICLIFILSIPQGCYSEKLFKKQLSRGAIAYRGVVAEYCANEYPVKTKTDSAAYKNSKNIIDSLSKAMKDSALITNKERELMLERIKDLQNRPVETKNCDSLSEAVYKLAAKEMARGDRLQEINNRLIIAANNLQPIRDTIENTAKFQVCRIELGKVIGLLVAETADVKKWKAKSKKHFLIMSGLGLLLLIIGGLKVRSMLRPKK